MTAIKDCSKTTSRRERLDQRGIQHIIQDRATCGLVTVNWVNLVIPFAFRLTTMTGVEEEKRIMRFGILDERSHRVQDIFLGRSRVFRILGEHSDILSFITVVVTKEIPHVISIVDASFQLVVPLTLVEYSNA